MSGLLILFGAVPTVIPVTFVPAAVVVVVVVIVVAMVAVTVLTTMVFAIAIGITP